MKKKLSKLFLVAFFCLGLDNSLQAGFGFMYPSTKEIPEIDSLIERAENLAHKEKYEEALEIFQLAIEKSTKMDYSKGRTKGYLGAATILYVQNKLEQATQNLIKAKEEPFAQESPEDMFEIYFREGLNLHVLGLYNHAIRRYKESIEVSKKIKDNSVKTDNFYKSYINIGDVYQMKNQNDSALYFYRAAFHSPTQDLNNKFVSAVSLADVFLEQNRMDSAKVYIQTSHELSQKLRTKTSDAMYQQLMAKYFESTGKNDSAAYYYERSFALKNSLKRPEPLLLKKLSEIYSKMGNESLSNEYLAKYVSLTDSLEIANRENVQVPILMAKNASKKKIESAESKSNFLLIILGISFLITAVFVYLYIKKQKKRNSFRKVENTQLKKKLNTAFEEVTELAQTNSPNFLSRFIEVYPEFYNYLISTYPDLTNADLKLCALMKLDYSTKEIAEISYSSIRTVQNRKYKLRKKFSLSPEENLNVWIQNLHIQSLNLA
jgi:tetratricopeptide (TPR) repeat protein